MQRKAQSLLPLLLLLSGLPASAAGSAVVVQIPGASGAELEALWREGALDAGGFRAFFERGEVATNLVGTDPTLPFAAAVALSTGAAPGAVGVVGERFRPPGSRAGESVTVERLRPGAQTLWGQAEAAGLGVGAVLWPGIDNRDDARRADWGIADRDTEHYPARSIRMRAHEWADPKYGIGPGPSKFWGLPRAVRSYSTPLRTSFPFVLPHDRAELVYELVAIDRTDDGKVNYDGLLVSHNIDPQDGYVGVAAPGEWLRIELLDPSGNRRAAPEVAWIKVIELAPDLSRAWIYVSSTRFARAFPSALLRKLQTDAIDWPGAPDERALEAGLAGGYGVDAATFVEMADRLARYAVDVALAGRKLYPTDLLLLSIPIFDPLDRGLLLVDPRQPGHTPERATALGAARRRAWQKLDVQLARLLAGLELEATTVFLVSPYANVPVHADVDLVEILRTSPATAAINASTSASWRSVVASGGLAHVYLSIAGRDEGGVIDAGVAEAATRAVRDALAAVRDDGAPVFDRVLLRREAARLGLDRPESGDVIVFARPGYRLIGGAAATAVTTRWPDVRAAAGYASSESASRGFVLALGRGIRARTARGPVELVDITARIARSIGVKPPKQRR